MSRPGGAVSRTHSAWARSRTRALVNSAVLKQAPLNGGGIAWLPRSSIGRALANAELLGLKLPGLIIRRPLNHIRGDIYAAPAGEALSDTMRGITKA